MAGIRVTDPDLVRAVSAAFLRSDPAVARFQAPFRWGGNGRVAPQKRCAHGSDQMRLTQPLLVSIHELVSFPVNGKDMLRIGGIVLELLPKLHDEVIDRACGGEILEPPYLVQEPVTRDYFAAALNQQAEDVELARRQLDWLAGARWPGASRNPARPSRTHSGQGHRFRL